MIELANAALVLTQIENLRLRTLVEITLLDNGIVDLELEGIPYWWDGGPWREEPDRIRCSLLRTAEVLSNDISVEDLPVCIICGA